MRPILGNAAVIVAPLSFSDSAWRFIRVIRFTYFLELKRLFIFLVRWSGVFLTTNVNSCLISYVAYNYSQYYLRRSRISVCSVSISPDSSFIALTVDMFAWLTDSPLMRFLVLWLWWRKLDMRFCHAAARCAPLSSSPSRLRSRFRSTYLNVSAEYSPFFLVCSSTSA